MFSRGNLVFQGQAGGKVNWEWHFPAQAVRSALAGSNSQLDRVTDEDILEEQERRSQAWTMLL